MKTDSFIEKINIFISKYSPVFVFITLLGTIAVGGSYLLSIKNNLENNNTLINKLYEELKSQSSTIISFKDSYYIKNEEIIEQLTKCTITMDGLNNQLVDLKKRLVTIESRLYDLNSKD